MSFALYELAFHPEIQMKARDEVKRVLEKNEGKFTYESVLEMSYLNQIFNGETRDDIASITNILS